VVERLKRTKLKTAAAVVAATATRSPDQGKNLIRAEVRPSETPLYRPHGVVKTTEV
jgi:hypothetical protein